MVTGWLGIAERDGRELGTSWHLSGLLFYWPADGGGDCFINLFHPFSELLKYLLDHELSEVLSFLVNQLHHKYRVLYFAYVLDTWSF